MWLSMVLKISWLLSVISLYPLMNSLILFGEWIAFYLVFQNSFHANTSIQKSLIQRLQQLTYLWNHLPSPNRWHHLHWKFILFFTSIVFAITKDIICHLSKITNHVVISMSSISFSYDSFSVTWSTDSY